VPIDPEIAKKSKNHKKLKMPDAGSIYFGRLPGLLFRALIDEAK